MKQRRAYSDDSLRFTPFGLSDEGSDNRESPRSLPQWFRNPVGAWGRDIEETDASHEVLQGRDEDGDSDPNTPGDRVNQLWEQVEETEEVELDAQEEAATREGALSSTIGVKYEPFVNDFDYESELGTALLQGSADTVARCLLAAARNDDVAFIRSIPASTFSECIRLLQPSNTTAGLTSAHMEISENVAKVFGISAVDEIVWENGKLLREVKAIRNAAGVRSTLADYRMLLRAARDLGSRPMADNMWASMLHDEITPDTQCYNYYMAAIVFDEVHFAVNRQKLRVIPFHKLARSHSKLGRGFTAFRVGEHGLKAKVIRFLNDMLRHGAIANEESFRVVMTALAREGDIETVKSILKRMWNIDVDGLQSGKDEEQLKPKNMEPSNPLRPSPDLLFTVAHAFGINNDIPTALRLVDFIARHYDLQISREIWSQLFEWTFVLSSTRTGLKVPIDETKTGQLPKQGLLNLWNTMTGSPYFVKPTMGMYNHMIKNLQQRDTVPLMYEKICEGVELLQTSKQEAYRAFKDLERHVRRQEQTLHPPKAPTETLRRKYEHLDLIRKRDHFWARRWMRLLLSTISTRVLIDDSQDWALRMIPRILWDWKYLAGTQGNNIRYEIPGGQVEFQIRDEEEIQRHHAVRRLIEERRREVLDKVPLILGEEWVLPRKVAKAREVKEQDEFMWQLVEHRNIGGRRRGRGIHRQEQG